MSVINVSGFWNRIAASLTAYSASSSAPDWTFGCTGCSSWTPCLSCRTAGCRPACSATFKWTLTTSSSARRGLASLRATSRLVRGRQFKPGCFCVKCQFYFFRRASSKRRIASGRSFRASASTWASPASSTITARTKKTAATTTSSASSIF